jgi:hypothetical protein
MHAGADDQAAPRDERNFRHHRMSGLVHESITEQTPA